MRNLDSCCCWRCMLCLCKVRNKFLVNFWNRTILLCIPCILYTYESRVTYFPKTYEPPLNYKSQEQSESRSTLRTQKFRPHSKQYGRPVSWYPEFMHPRFTAQLLLFATPVTVISPASSPYGVPAYVIPVMQLIATVFLQKLTHVFLIKITFVICEVKGESFTFSSWRKSS